MSIQASNADLMHYGVLGMKWGVRRYRNADGSFTPAGRKREARQYARSLNKLDDETVKHIGKYIESDYKTNKYVDKASREAVKTVRSKLNSKEQTITIGSGPGSNKFNKYMAKADKHYKKRQEEEKAYKDLEQQTWKLIAEVSEKGYDVSGIKLPKYVADGKLYASAFLGGPIGQTAYTAIQEKRYKGKYVAYDSLGRRVDQNPNGVVGVYYQVRKKE